MGSQVYEEIKHKERFTSTAFSQPRAPGKRGIKLTKRAIQASSENTRAKKTKIHEKSSDFRKSTRIIATTTTTNAAWSRWTGNVCDSFMAMLKSLKNKFFFIDLKDIDTNINIDEFISISKNDNRILTFLLFAKR